MTQRVLVVEDSPTQAEELRLLREVVDPKGLGAKELAA